jgi:hypothetical protein
MNTLHELAHRRNDGIDVTMFWEAETNRVTVAVTDAKGGEAFDIDVLPDMRAMDVFHHPFAYAPTRRVSERPRSPKRHESADGEMMVARWRPISLS